MFKIKNKRHQKFLLILLLSFNRSHICSGVSIFDFEQVNAGWEM